MTKLTPTGSSNTKPHKIKVFKILFVIATIIFVLCSLVAAYPVLKVLMYLVKAIALLFYGVIVIFSLGLALLDSSFRNSFSTICSMESKEEFMNYYPQIVNYCFIVLGVAILLYFINVLFVKKNKNDNYTFYVTNIIMLIVSILVLIALIIIKIII